MSVDRLRIEPMPPVRARGPQGLGSQQDRADAPFAHVLARAESDPAQHDAAPDRVASGGATQAAETTDKSDKTDQPKAAETAAVDASEHDSERDKPGQAKAPDHARATQGHASRPNRPASTSPDSKTEHCDSDSLASTDASGATQGPDTAASRSAAKPDEKLAEAPGNLQATEPRPDPAAATAPTVLSSLAQALTPAQTGAATALTEEGDAAQEVGDPLGRSPRRARVRDSASDDAQSGARSLQSGAESSPALADSKPSRPHSDRAAEQAKTLAALNGGIEHNGRAAPEQIAPATTPASFEHSLRAALTGQPTSPAAAPPPSFPITVPFGESRFGAAFGERINWMVREGLQNAELVLNPPDMGPIRVALSLDNDAATFSFNAPQANTRAAIEQSLPRLRELLAEQGVTLGETSIDAGAGRQGDQGSQHPSGQSRPSTPAFLPGHGTTGVMADEPLRAQAQARARAAGRIDLFA
jgi:flagellar hook-length control protein FliK